MFVSLPSRIKWSYAWTFIVLLGLLELLVGSEAYLVFCIAVFTIFTVDAFNVSGGMNYPSGMWIFFNATLTLLLGLCAKVAFGEPVQRNFLVPRKTFTIYMASAGVIWAVAQANRRFRRRTPFISGDLEPQRISRSVVGLLVCGVIATFILPLVLRNTQGSLGSIASQLNVFLSLAMMLAVFYRVKLSGGRRSLNVLSLLAGGLLFLLGIMNFSKQQLFTSFAVWLLSSLAAGYYTSRKQMVLVGILAFAMVEVLVPYSQYGRDHKDEFASPVQVITLMVTNPAAIQSKAKAKEVVPIPTYHMFDKEEGLMDRLNMISMDDALVRLTDEDHHHGLQIIFNLALNMIPHFLYPDKPEVMNGHIYGSELSLLAPEDHSTAISFSAMGEAYHSTGWTGIFITMPIILFALFMVTDSLVGSIRYSPWGLNYLILFAHSAPEGSLADPFYEISMGVVKLLFGYFVAVYVAPLIGSLVLGPERPSMGMVSSPR